MLRLLETIRRFGPLSRAELSRRTGLSKPTVSNLIRSMQSAGLVSDVGHGKSAGGRPPLLMAFNASAGHFVGVDLGGTTVRAGVADLDGRILATRRAPTCTKSVDAVVAQVDALVRDVVRTADVPYASVLSVTIGTPGVIDPTTRRLSLIPNIPALEGQMIEADVQRALERPVSVQNDVNLAALGEYACVDDGAPKTLVYVSIGTGLGCGIVIDGQVFLGSGGRAGEIGYLPASISGSGNIEQVLSGPGIAAAHADLGGLGDPHAAFDEADRGEAPGSQVVDRFIDELAWMLTGIVTLLDPDIVVIGGGIGMRCAPYLARLSARFDSASPSRPSIALSKLGDDAGLRGAVTAAVATGNRRILDHALGEEVGLATDSRSE